MNRFIRFITSNKVLLFSIENMYPLMEYDPFLKRELSDTECVHIFVYVCKCVCVCICLHLDNLILWADFTINLNFIYVSFQ